MEECEWCDGYFMDRDTEPIEDPIVILPIKERRRRSRSRAQTRVRPESPGDLLMRYASTWNFSKTLNRWLLEVPGVTNSDRILDIVKSCVPELDREGLRVANTTIVEVLTQGDIQFSTNYMAMSDTQMVRAFAREAKRSLTGRYYVGITENPVRRLRMHADGHRPFFYMLIVRVAFTSIETASWEKLAIQHFREQLGFLALLNVGDGGERASGGIPHYGYILRCR